MAVVGPPRWLELRRSAASCGHTTIGAFRVRHDAVTRPIEIEVASDGFNGFSRFSFEVEGEALRSMTIVA
jgi:hypothetical protein